MLPFHQVVPSCGWEFLQGETKITATTWDDLLKYVKEHRVSNGIPIGNFVKDIEDQIKERTKPVRKGK